MVVPKQYHQFLGRNLRRRIIKPERIRQGDVFVKVLISFVYVWGLIVFLCHFMPFFVYACCLNYVEEVAFVVPVFQVLL